MCIKDYKLRPDIVCFCRKTLIQIENFDQKFGKTDTWLSGSYFIFFVGLFHDHCMSGLQVFFYIHNLVAMTREHSKKPGLQKSKSCEESVPLEVARQMAGSKEAYNFQVKENAAHSNAIIMINMTFRIKMVKFNYIKILYIILLAYIKHLNLIIINNLRSDKL